MESRKPVRMIMICNIRSLLNSGVQVMNRECAEYCHTLLISDDVKKIFHYQKMSCVREVRRSDF